MPLQHLSQSFARFGHQIVRVRQLKVGDKLSLSSNATFLLRKMAFA